ncbi:alpha/beta hydrolase [Leifsonia sp. NPDC058194]|uniref:alpha/beta hydrolase n=1 Tax=Leifsonia sp. NPDC058194 TaxID=3346374 RepID=UPI0036D8333E
MTNRSDGSGPPTTPPTTPPAATGPRQTQPKRRSRRALKATAFSLAGLVAAIGLALAATSITNAVATSAEEGEITSYGRKVDVDGKKMNVVVSGSGEQTIVLLPGFGTAAPALDFAPLTEKLDADYRVVVVEPFGYGLSDQTDRPRTSANIAAEVHDALGALDIHRYVLMGHSIAGIYGLEYVNLYRDEVQAFVGIDSSVPTQPGMDDGLPIGAMQAAKSLGLMRVLTSVSDPYAGLPFSDEAKKQMNILSQRNSLSPTYVNETEHFSQNFHDAQRLSFPRDLPVLLFVQDDNTDVAGWMPLHEEQAASVDRGEVVSMAGEHYLHHTLSAEIAQETTRFLNESR